MNSPYFPIALVIIKKKVFKYRVPSKCLFTKWDLFIEGVIKFSECIDKYDQEIGSFEAWFNRVLENKFKNLLKKESLRRRTQENLPDAIQDWEECFQSFELPKLDNCFIFLNKLDGDEKLLFQTLLNPSRRVLRLIKKRKGCYLDQIGKALGLSMPKIQEAKVHILESILF